jgi:transcriptional regulator with XRE-family HTH domain
MTLERSLRYGLLDRLRETGLQQQEVAAMVGINRQYVNQLLTGKKAGSLRVWDQLFEATGVKIKASVLLTSDCGS